MKVRLQKYLIFLRNCQDRHDELELFQLFSVSNRLKIAFENSIGFIWILLKSRNSRV